MNHLLKTKNLIVSLLVIAVLIAGYYLLVNPNGKLRQNALGFSTDQSIAVLPFENMGNDTTQQYFSDGLAEGVRNSLAHVNGLKVCASSSSFQFRGKDVDIKETGRKLGVHTILKASVQHQEDRVRITAQLINVEDGFQLWSEQFDENMEKV